MRIAGSKNMRSYRNYHDHYLDQVIYANASIDCKYRMFEVQVLLCTY